MDYVILDEDAAAGMALLRSATKQQPTQDKKELLQRFVENRPFAASMKNAKDFNPDTFRRRAEEHSTKYSIPKFGEAERRHLQGGPQTVVFNQVATYKDVRFFMNTQKTEFCSVINEGMVKDMLEKGFIEYHMSHHTDRASLSRYAATTPGVTNSAWDEQPVGGVPAGKKYPDLWKKDGDTTAAAIVRAVEERVLDGKTKTVWSPYRLWTLEDRKTGDTKLTKWLAAYYYIRHMKKDERPEDITTTLPVMYAEAVADTRPQKEKWYNLTLEVYKEVCDPSRQ
jgi:hypothetical protein